MKSVFKKLLIGGLVALLVGGVLFTIAFAASGFSFEKLSGLHWESKSFTESAAASSVVIDVDNSDVTVKFDKNADKITVSYYVCNNRSGKELKNFNVTDSNGTLSLKEHTRWQYDLFLWTYKDTDVTVIIPEGRAVSLDISTDNGDVNIYGSANIPNLHIDTDNGDAEINGQISAKGVTVETDNGDVEITGSFTANSLTVETDNGTFEAEGSLTVNTLSIETDNGDIDAEDALITANKILIETDNGDVEAKLFGAASDYKTIVKTDNGRKNIENNITGERELYIETDNGDVYIIFANE